MRPLRVVASVRNNRLIRLREELGMSAPQAAAAIGMDYGTYNRMEALKKSPINGKSGEWCVSALRICEYHGVSPEFLWPEVVRNISRIRLVAEVGTPELAMGEASALLASGTQETDHNDAETGEILDELLGHLSPRHERVLRARVFDGITLDEAAEKFGVSRERLRQIEARALTKLRGVVRRDGRLDAHW